MNKHFQLRLIHFPAIFFFLATSGQSQTFYIGSTADSVSITDASNRLVAKVLWSANAVSGDNDDITATIFPQAIVPPSQGGQNYQLAPPIKMAPVLLSSVRFKYGSVRLRIYADTSLFHVRDLMELSDNAYHIEAEHYLPPSVFHPLAVFRYDSTLDCIEVFPDSVSTLSTFLLTATNILLGNINPGDVADSLRANVLVPGGKSLQLNAGVRLVPSNFARIIVRGTMSALGTQEDSVFLGTDITVAGKADSSIRNNVEQLFCSFTSGTHVDVNYGNAEIENSRLIGVGSEKFSSLHLRRSTISSLAVCSYSSFIMDSCRFLPGAYFSSDHSILEIENTLFENVTYDMSPRYSLLHLRNNTIYADAFLEPIDPLGCFVLYEGNSLWFSGTSNSNRVGFSVYEGNYAIIRNNIVKGFRNAVEVGYGNKATIYNNTFVQSGGVSLYGTVDSVSVFNNIFSRYDGFAINVDVSTGHREDNRVWVDSNAYFSGRYINQDTAGTGIVLGNTFALFADPLFADTVAYRLQKGSGAIDRGARVIPSFKGTFAVLDTVILLQESISLTDYVGSRPDLGAQEYHTPVEMWNAMQSKLPTEFVLDQNYPNPLNPSTTIGFAIPKKSFVRLKVYDILGKEVGSLASGEYAPGIYSRTFDASRLPSGVYYYRLQAGNFFQTRKLLFLK